MICFSLLMLYYCLGYLGTSQMVSIKKRRQYCFLALFPIFFMTAFRASSVGSDTSIYMRAYYSISQYASLAEAIKHSRMEIGYVCLTYILSHIGFPFYSTQIVISFFIYSSVSHFYAKFSPSIWLSAFVFFTLRYAFGAMNTIRMWIAAAILLYTIPCLQNRRSLRFIVLCLFAALFHTTALTFIILYPLTTIPINRRTLTVVLTGATGILIIAKPFFIWLTRTVGRYSGYLRSEYFNIEGNSAVFFSLAIDVFLFAFIYYENQKQLGNCTTDTLDYREARISMEQIEIWSALIVLSLSIIGLSNSIMGRVSIYFSIFYTTALPRTINRIIFPTNKRIMKYVLLISLAAQFYTVMLLRPNWNHVLPYSFFWS